MGPTFSIPKVDSFDRKYAQSVFAGVTGCFLLHTHKASSLFLKDSPSAQTEPLSLTVSSYLFFSRPLSDGCFLIGRTPSWWVLSNFDYSRPGPSNRTARRRRRTQNKRTDCADRTRTHDGDLTRSVRRWLHFLGATYCGCGVFHKAFVPIFATVLSVFSVDLSVPQNSWMLLYRVEHFRPTRSILFLLGLTVPF